MSEASKMLHIIKKAAVDAVANTKPAQVLYGTVTSESPLKIQVDQKLVFTDTQLVLTHNVIDRTCSVEVDGIWRQCKMENGLKAGDQVLLLQKQGGQKYIVWDKVVQS